MPERMAIEALNLALAELTGDWGDVCIFLEHDAAVEDGTDLSPAEET